MELEILELGARAHNGLLKAGFQSVEELLSADYADLSKLESVGKKSLAEILVCVLKLRRDDVLYVASILDSTRGVQAEKAERYDRIVSIISGAH